MATAFATKQPVAAMDDGLADEHTPFIFNAWYVACFSHELEPGTPLARKLLGINVVLYRTASGDAVAMRDRCPHRSFPLSASTIEGDDIVCGYHGIRYGPDGACKAVPTQEHAPRAMRVRAYAVREASPCVWIWMGDPAIAAETPLPPCGWATAAEGWALSTGSMVLQANYVFLHENLMDLSHLTFLHKNTFGTPDYAAAPFTTDVNDRTIVVSRTVAPTLLPPLYADPLDIHGDAARIVTSTYYSPGLSVTAVVLQNLELSGQERVDHHIRTAQLVTPYDRDRVLYHFVIARDFAKDDAETGEFILTGIKAAFQEDAFALESLARVRLEEEDAFTESSIASDKAGVMLRRRLRKQAEAETISA